MYRTLTAAALGLTLLTACSSDDPPAPDVAAIADDGSTAASVRNAQMMAAAGGDIIDTALAAGNFTVLAAALEATDLIATLGDDDARFTVFAPTDAAFDALGSDTIDALLADPDTLRDILLYHVVADTVVDAETAISLAGTRIDAANGDELAISLDGDALRINDATVIAADVFATNGVIHAIDAVLMPPSDEMEPTTPPPSTGSDVGTLLDVARSAGDFTILVAALEATGLDGAIGHPDDLYTVFAPTDDAFRALGQETIDALLADPDTLRDILLYHVLPGRLLDAERALGLVGIPIDGGNGDRLDLNLRDGSLFVNDSQLVATDIRGNNGIIHVIDAVLLPPTN